jgi:hypothetical protein
VLPTLRCTRQALAEGRLPVTLDNMDLLLEPPQQQQQQQ